MTTKPIKKNGTPSPYSQFFAEELNLSRLPFFASSTKALKDKTETEFRRTIDLDGREVECLWRVTANARYGYPGPFAEAVHAAILQIVTEQGFPIQNPVKFSFYEICIRLGIETSGQNIKNIKDAIRATRLAGIEIRHSFQTKDGRRPTFEDIQNLYSRVIFFGDSDPATGESVEISAVWLADFYRDSLNSGHIRPIDFEYFKQIREKSWSVTKIYQYLGYRFAAGCFGKHQNPYAKVDYDDLCVIADVKRYQYTSAAKRSFETAHEILIETGFIKRVEWVEEKAVRKGEGKKMYIHYYPGQRARDEYQKAHFLVTKQLSLTFEPKMVGETSPILIDDLIALGVTEKRATDIVGTFDAGSIERQLDHLEYLGELGKAPGNRAAWLVKAIQEGYVPPEGFKGRKERAADRKAKEVAEAEKKQKEEAEKRSIEETERRRKVKEFGLDQQFAALSETAQGELIAKLEDRARRELPAVIQKKSAAALKKSPTTRFMYYEILEQLLNEY